MNVLLVYGGKSCEHDISIITACLARGYLANHNVIGCYLDRNNRAYFAEKLSPMEHLTTKFRREMSFILGGRCVEIRTMLGKKRVHIDCAVNCCHGVNGEDGAVAGLLQLAGIPDVESGVLCCGVAMDKYLTKLQLKSLGIDVVEGVLFDGDIDGVVDRLGFPLIVKPCTLGSSIGIGIAHDINELKTCIDVASQFDKRILIEQALQDFLEINCSAMTVDGNVTTSPVDFPLTSHEILTFADKYLSGTKGIATGKHITDEYDDKVAEITEKIYTALGFGGVIRVDFLASDGKLYVNEINTVPGSLAYGMWKDKYSATQFGDLLLKEGVRRFDSRQSLSYRYRSEVLSGCKGKK